MEYKNTWVHKALEPIGVSVYTASGKHYICKFRGEVFDGWILKGKVLRWQMRKDPLRVAKKGTTTSGFGVDTLKEEMLLLPENAAYSTFIATLRVNASNYPLLTDDELDQLGIVREAKMKQ
jgi:hypothetical protein